MSIKSDELVPGHFYEVVYPGDDGFNIYLCEAYSNNKVQTFWKNDKEYKTKGYVTSAISIREVPKRYAVDRKKDPISNEEALDLLMTKEEW